MKSTFKEYFPLEEEELNKLWANGIIVFDTNVLLNFYRYSSNTVDEFLSVLRQIKEKLWLPYQVGYEFNEERLSVIQQQSKIYHESTAKLDLLLDEFLNKNRNPFLSDELLNSFSNVIEDVKSELSTQEDRFAKRLTRDDILIDISEIFEDKTGDNFDEDTIKGILNDGVKRYQSKTPPGYLDKDKPDNKKYGDLIIWNQIINQAEKENKPVLFVTDDRKDDWWLINSGKIISPRPELRQEFYSKTGNIYYSYQPFKFLEIAKNNFEITVNTTTISEVKELVPFNNKPIETERDISIVAILEKLSDDYSADKFTDFLKFNYYESEVEDIDLKLVKLTITIPKIEDLIRRIHNTLKHQLSDFNLRLVDFISS